MPLLLAPSVTGSLGHLMGWDAGSRKWSWSAAPRMPLRPIQEHMFVTVWDQLLRQKIFDSDSATENMHS